MKLSRTALVLATLASLAGCKELDPLWCNKNPGACNGDGGLNGDGGVAIIGGTVSGLSNGAAGLVLQNNGGDDKLIVSNGNFMFATAVPVGSMYDVTVLNQPTNPSQTCTVTGGTGTAVTDVTSVDVTCTVTAYTVGGTLTGLASGNAMLTDTFGSPAMTDNLSVPSSQTMWTFGTSVPSGDSYAVSALPSGCRVNGGTGIMGDGNVTTVVVNCAANEYTIGGTISGLNGTVKLHNGGDTISVSSNGAFAFPTPVSGGGSYNVTVSQQPTYPPASQTCTVTNGTGNNVQGDISGITVTCVTNSFSVGGSSMGVNGTVVLQDNGGDDKTLNQGNSTYTFATKILSGKTYAVTVSQEPLTLGCTVANANGTIGNGNATNANVSCSYRDPGILCGSMYCSVGQVCCDPEGTTPSCTTSSACTAFQMPCDDKADCGMGKGCCAMLNPPGKQVTGVSCSSSCSGGLYLCDPNAPNCPSGTTCQAFSLLQGYYACF